MKVVQVIQDCGIMGGASKEILFKKDKFYILSDEFYHRLKILLEPVLGIEIPFSEIYNEFTGQDLNGRKILSMRHGGGGDILFMTTALRKLKSKFNDAKIGVATGEMYFPLLENDPIINSRHTLPICLDDWNKFNYHIMFENLIENNPNASTTNAYDLFLEKLGFDPKEVDPVEKLPKLFITHFEKRNILKSYEYGIHRSCKKVGIQVEASSPIRKYPLYNFRKVIEHLVSKGYDVYLFGSDSQRGPIEYLQAFMNNPEKVYSVITDLRKSITIASFMDYFIAPDSMFVHVAGALGVPLLGLYGPFHSNLRMRYFSKSIGLNASTACSPCFLHGHFPCPKGDPSPCFSVLPPEIVINAFEELERG